MGWFNADAPYHEGYPVACIENGAGSFDELRREDPAQSVTHVQAGCDCGWRSPRLRVTPTEWNGILMADEYARERLSRLWEEHVALALYHERVLASKVDPCDDQGRPWFDRASPLEIVFPLAKALLGLHRCHCGHVRRHHNPAGVCLYRGHTDVPCGCTGFRFRAVLP